MFPDLIPLGDDLATVACDALVIGAQRGEAGGLTSRGLDALAPDLGRDLHTFLDATGFDASLGEVRMIATLGRIPAPALVLVGLGARGELSARGLRTALHDAGAGLTGAPRVASAVHLELEDDALRAASATGLLLGLSRRGEGSTAFVGFAGTADAITGAEITARAIDLVRRLVNEPPHSLNPAGLAERAREIASDAALECTVWGTEELEQRGFGGLLAVARGSEQEPHLIRLSYRPEQPTRRIALAGKGVTFDAGGVNLKLDRDGLTYMKFDMAGGATVIGAMTALASLGVRAQVDAIVPVAANLLGPRATLPGEVIRQFGGTTTEVTDTDSEGRLLLGDALAYASALGADIIVDVATLTETTERALGPEITGIYANDDALAVELVAAGERAGEPMWQLPLFQPYAQLLRSAVADVRNQSLADGFLGGGIKASLFLERFVGEGISWAHLDIAGTAYERNFTDPTAGGATGVPTGTLLEWLKGQ
jgi:leucyl aminopeptidase